MTAVARMRVTIVALGLMAGRLPAQAQDTDAVRASPPAAASPSIEVTPFIAMDSRGGLPFGAAVSFPLSSSFSVETEVGYREGEGGVHALSASANLLYELPRIGRIAPYLATGAGLAQYGVPLVTRDGTLIATEPRIALEINAGGGIKVPVRETLDMRTDARWFKSLGVNGTEHWRIAHGVAFDVGKR